MDAPGCQLESHRTRSHTHPCTCCQAQFKSQVLHSLPVSACATLPHVHVQAGMTCARCHEDTKQSCRDEQSSKLMTMCAQMWQSWKSTRRRCPAARLGAAQDSSEAPMEVLVTVSLPAVPIALHACTPGLLRPFHMHTRIKGQPQDAVDLLCSAQ